jgi:hypothetical protein
MTIQRALDESGATTAALPFTVSNRTVLLPPIHLQCSTVGVTSDYLVRAATLINSHYTTTSQLAKELNHGTRRYQDQRNARNC